MSFVTHAQSKDASAFKSLVEETLAGKVVQVLEGLKAHVASNMFEEGGVSGGVTTVKKKPAPEAAGSVVLGSKETPNKKDGVVHAGRSDKSNDGTTGDAVLPGQKNESFNEELQILTQTLEEAHIKPGSEEHMAHHVHAVHTGDAGGIDRMPSPGHTETQHYHIHHSGVEMGTDSKGNPSDTHSYHVMHKGSGEVHKFHVTASPKGGHHVTHMGSL